MVYVLYWEEHGEVYTRTFDNIEEVNRTRRRLDYRGVNSILTKVNK